MTEEFLEKMNNANKVSLENYRKQIKSIYEENEKQADLYLRLILSLIETFDYKLGVFKIGSLNEKIKKELGHPQISAQISEETNKGTIRLDYKDINYLYSLYHNNYFSLINHILEKNDVRIYETHEDWFLIEFDASLIIDTKRQLLVERKAFKF